MKSKLYNLIDKIKDLIILGVSFLAIILIYGSILAIFLLPIVLLIWLIKGLIF